MNTIKKLILACIVAFVSMPLHAETNNNSGKRIVKWVDSQGVTYYGDKLPAQEAGRDNTVLNNQGITVKKIDITAIAKNAELEKKSIELSRKDNAIIASYSSLEEVDLARDRNLKLEEFELLSLFQRQINNRKNLQQRNVLSAGFIQRNKEVPPKIIQEIIDLQTNINKTDALIAARKKNMVNIYVRFNQDKLRYAELRPRNQTLKDINFKRKQLTELVAWKNEAIERLNTLQRQAIVLKRSGDKADEGIGLRIQKVTEEIARADEQIALTMASIKNAQDSFSKQKASESAPN